MSRIKDLPLSERPREKAMTYGIDHVSNQELLAILIRSGTKDKSALEIANDLLVRFEGLSGLLHVSYVELEQMKGIHRAKAMTLIAGLELARRCRESMKEEGAIVRSPEQIAALLSTRTELDVQEHCFLILLNTKNRIITVKDLFVGGLDSHLVHPRDIFREAVRYNSARLILAHNHPSGDPEPSESDIETTKRIAALGEELGISVLDHVIVGNQKYVSLKTRHLF